MGETRSRAGESEWGWCVVFCFFKNNREILGTGGDETVKKPTKKMGGASRLVRTEVHLGYVLDVQKPSLKDTKTARLAVSPSRKNSFAFRDRCGLPRSRFPPSWLFTF